MQKLNSDIKIYLKKTLVVMGLFFLAQIILFFLGYFFKGFFIGSLLASVNIFVLGHTIYVILTKISQDLSFPRRRESSEVSPHLDPSFRWGDNSKFFILLPIFSFLLMSFAAYFIATNCPEIILEFALGLAVPLLFALVVVFKPF